MLEVLDLAEWERAEEEEGKSRWRNNCNGFALRGTGSAALTGAVLAATGATTAGVVGGLAGAAAVRAAARRSAFEVSLSLALRAGGIVPGARMKLVVTGEVIFAVIGAELAKGKKAVSIEYRIDSLSFVPNRIDSTKAAPSGMATATAETFEHRLGVLISRSLNTLNPNPTLAARVFQLSSTLPDLAAFTKAISSFGKFTQPQASELYDLCQSQDTLDHAFQLPGLTVTDSDVLSPDQPAHRPGLSLGGEKHTFKAPNAPRSSALGLDRLALEKRREREQADRATKRTKYDDEDSSFKSEFILVAYYLALADPLAQSLLDQRPLTLDSVSTTLPPTPVDSPTRQGNLSKNIEQGNRKQPSPPIRATNEIATKEGGERSTDSESDSTRTTTGEGTKGERRIGTRKVDRGTADGTGNE